MGCGWKMSEPRSSAAAESAHLITRSGVGTGTCSGRRSHLQGACGRGENDLTRFDAEAHGVEDPMDERAGLLVAELLRYLDRLIDDDDRRRRILVDQLIGRDAEDVAIHDGHPRHAPVMRDRAEDRVEPLHLFHRPLHERARELDYGGLDSLPFPEGLEGVLGRLRREVELEEK